MSKNRKLSKVSKSFDLFLLFLWTALASFFSITFDAVFLTTVALFFVVPCIFLILRNKKNIKKILVASVALGLILSFTFDFLAEFNNAWNWNGGLLVEKKILGVVQFDVLIWFFFWVMYFILFYEHFIDDERFKKISKNAPRVYLLGALSIACVFLVFLINPSLFYIPYAYLILCLGISIVFILIARKRLKLIKKIVPVSLYFFFVYLVYELTALYTQIWTFPGQYVHKISLFSLEFPLEELIFWIVLSSTIGVSYYEVGFDDER